MPYLPDLSPYPYGERNARAEADLCVGWLAAKHPYPTRRPDDQLVDALLRCCLRPVRLCRGFQMCDICFKILPRMLCHNYHGREIHLGNGEIRVSGPEDQTYTAPTLVAHYVAAHRYAPPAPFVEGVLRRAREIYVLHGEPLQRIKKLNVTDRYDLCLDALRALQAQHPNDWLPGAITAFEAAKPALDPAVWASYETEMERLESILYDQLLYAGEADDDPRAAAARAVHQFFVYVKHGSRFARKETLQLTAEALERAHEAGLSEWRPDVRPSRLEATAG